MLCIDEGWTRERKTHSYSRVASVVPEYFPSRENHTDTGGRQLPTTNDQMRLSHRLDPQDDCVGLATFTVCESPTNQNTLYAHKKHIEQIVSQ